MYPILNYTHGTERYGGVRFKNPELKTIQTYTQKCCYGFIILKKLSVYVN